MIDKKIWSYLMLTIDLALAAILMTILATLICGHIVYHVGLDFIDELFSVLFVLLCVRGMTVPKWSALRHQPLGMKIKYVFIFIVCIPILWLVLTGHFSAAVKQSITSRATFRSMNNESILNEVTQLGDSYPNVEFVKTLTDTIPEDASIALITDQRPHILNYELYPRRCYALPAMQQNALRAHMEFFWNDSPHRDPMHQNPTIWDDAGEGDPADYKVNIGIQEDMRKMIDEHGIEWVVYYDSYYPKKSWVHRIGD